MSISYDYDVIGVGFGPANIAVAIAMEELGFNSRVRFFESQASSAWQKGMLIENSDIQNHPLRDLVTPRNPRSKYTFVNFLYENGRLFEHLNLGMIFPYRTEYAQYIDWVARHFTHQVSYNVRINEIKAIQNESGVVVGFEIKDNNNMSYRTRSLVVAPGRTPYIPSIFQKSYNSTICHISNYLENVTKILSRNPKAEVGIIGGSQSAIEAMLHLHDNYPNSRIVGIHRSFGYRLKDVSPFTGEVYFPEFVDFYYDSSLQNKKKLIKDLYLTNYGATDGDALDRLYRKMYLGKINKKNNIDIHRCSEIIDVKEEGQKVALWINKMNEARRAIEKFDLVILATGFRNIGPEENEERFPPILESLIPYMSLDEFECLKIDKNYQVEMDKKVSAMAMCFLNGLCESSHGMGDAGSFSLLSLRAKAIVETLKQVSHIPC